MDHHQPHSGKGTLFVGDDLAEFGNVLLEFGDFLRPGASGVVRVGESGGVLAFGFGEIFGEVVEALLQGGAGHMEKPITGCGGWIRQGFVLSQ